MEIFKTPILVIIHDHENEVIKVNILGEDLEFDVSEKSIVNYEKNQQEQKSNSWKKQNIKNQTTNFFERDLIGFHGNMLFSNNAQYCVIHKCASYKQNDGYLALVDTQLKELLYKRSITNVRDGLAVANNGLVFFGDISQDFSNKETAILDHDDDFIFYRKMNAVVDKSAFSEDGQLLAFTTLHGDFIDGHSLVVIDCILKRIVNLTSLENNIVKINFDGHKIKCHVSNI